MDSEFHQNQNEKEVPEVNGQNPEEIRQKTTGQKGQMGHVCNQMEKENATAARRAGIEIRQQKEVANQEVQDEKADQQTSEMDSEVDLFQIQAGNQEIRNSVWRRPLQKGYEPRLCQCLVRWCLRRINIS